MQLNPGHLVTIFGGGGFIGRYLVQAIAATGARMRVCGRDPQTLMHVKPLAALGQIELAGADVRDPRAVQRACAGASHVVNLVGILNGDFRAVQADGAGHVARAAAAAGAQALVHVSAIGADPESASAYGRSKGDGEAAVLAAFPRATILRPSIIFGPEDQFTNRFASLAQLAPLAMPVVAGGTRFQPVYVVDVAQAVAAALAAPGEHGGRVYALGGPRTYSFRELLAYILRESRVSKPLVPVPDALAGAMATVTGWLPGAPMTRDQWLMLQHDNVIGDAPDGLAALGVAPTPLEAVAPTWLVRHRRHGRFHRDAA